LYQGFLPQLKKYLLPRILRLLAPHLYARESSHGPSGAAEADSWTKVVLNDDRIYHHQSMRVRYTTYDVRRAEDIIRLKGDPNVMVLAEHHSPGSSLPPYRYARILGIFHANVRFAGALRDGTYDRTSHRIDFLWVRWYVSCGYPSEGSWTLERVKFPAFRAHDSLGFLDPLQVLRGVHLIPQFSLGRQARLSVLSRWLGDEPPWNFYYINRYCFLPHSKIDIEPWY
jgi:hypothetical protein